MRAHTRTENTFVEARRDLFARLCFHLIRVSYVCGVNVRGRRFSGVGAFDAADGGCCVQCEEALVAGPRTMFVCCDCSRSMHNNNNDRAKRISLLF